MTGGVERVRDAALAQTALAHNRYSGADIEQARLAAQADSSVGAYKDGAYLSQLAAESQRAPDILGTNVLTTVDTAGGTTIKIYGEGFLGATGVTLKGAAATSVVVDSNKQITCVTPARTAGAGDVVVTTPNGSDTLTNGITYA